MTQAVLDKKPSYMRTFMLHDKFSHLSINLLEVFSELKLLRVLDLTRSSIRKVLRSIGNLIHLRYLNLSQNHITVLPDSITLLSNLQYLNLSFNHELGELPKELGNMQNLRDLDLQSHFKLTHMPCGLSQLTNLRSLSLFIASDKIDTCSIIELENLKLHGKMRIKFSKDFKNYSCGGRKIFKNKNLNELRLEFNGSERYDKDMLDGLCPNTTSLTKLDIRRYGSRQFPTWLMESQLPNLVEVSLVNCCGCKHIPQFGNLQSLKKLYLQSMDDITHMGAEFHGYRGFPSLQELLLHGMDNLEEWPESHVVDQLFPLLQKLWILNCPKLRSMPRLPRIQELEIKKSCCSESILSSCVGRLTSLSVLRVEEMNNMTSLPSGCIRNLTSLTKLKITKCRELQSLPWDEMPHLEMLHKLTVERCYNLASFPSEVGLLSSHYFLQLLDCPSIILQPEELIQILNLVDEFYIGICGNKVDLRWQLQYLPTLKDLYLCGSHVPNHYMIGYGIQTLSHDELESLMTEEDEFMIGHGIQTLRICCWDELESLMTAEAASSIVLQQLHVDGISNLTILPEWLQHLNSLRVLSIEDCPQLERVPRGLKNLHTLEALRIVNCPQLKSRCEREIGEDWSIISHVPDVYI